MELIPWIIGLGAIVLFGAGFYFGARSGRWYLKDAIRRGELKDTDGKRFFIDEVDSIGRRKRARA